MHVRVNRRSFCTAAVVLLVGTSCDTPTLGTGSTLSVSFEASVLHPAAAPSDLPKDKASCAAAGGAVVDLRAWGTDGQPAHDAEVTVWLAPSVSAQLVPLSTSCVSTNDICIALDNSGEGNACLLPGADYGTIMVFAHSGTVQQSASISVSAYTLAPGSMMAIDVAPQNLTNVIPAQASTCGVPVAGACSPGQGRSASVTVTASTPDGTTLPPDGTVISLDVTAGWLVSSGKCNQGTASGPLTLMTTNGSAGATWCFGDGGASGVLHAHSGTVTAMANHTVSAIPESLVLTSSAAAVANSGTVTLTAVVTGCDGAGVSGVPILFRTTQGTAQLSSTTPVSSNGDGIATITATITTGPATFSAAIAAAQQVDCAVSVGVAP